jgi:hypothetical protein
LQGWEDVLGDHSGKVREALGFQVIPTELLLREDGPSELLLRIGHKQLWRATRTSEPGRQESSKPVPCGVPARGNGSTRFTGQPFFIGSGFT